MPRTTPDATARSSELVVGVRSFACWLAGSAGPGPGALGRNGWATGARAHGRYQRLAAASLTEFRAERPLAGVVDLPRERVRLQGRADGVWLEDGARWVVEELKSSAAAADSPEASIQAALYAWLLHRETGEAVRAEVVEIDELGHPRRRRAVPLEVDYGEATVPKQLSAYAEECRRWRERARREGSRPLLRPVSRWRPVQREIREVVTAALAAEELCLLEAPTGSGKSAAVLEPALRHALERGLRLFVLTPKRTQQREHVRLLDEMLGERRPCVVQRGAKRSLCGNDAVACHHTRCGRAERDLDPEAFLGGVGVRTREVLRNLGDEGGMCAYRASRLLSERLPVVVGDFHLLLSGEADGGSPYFDGDVLVVDEVHQLAERARKTFSSELSVADLSVAAASLEFLGATAAAEMRRALDSLASWVRATAESCAEAVSLAAGATPWAVDELGAVLRELDRDLDAYLTYRIDTGALDESDPVLRTLTQAWQIYETLCREPPGYAAVFDARADRASLGAFCLDPAPRLEALLDRSRGAVGLSATIPPARDAEQLGFGGRRARFERIAEPWDPTRRRVVIDPSVDTRFAARERAIPRVADRLARILEAVPGNTLVLVPSFRWIRGLCAELEGGPLELLAQGADDSDARRAGLLDALAADGERRAVLAVFGGVLGEGVNYRPGALSALVAIGPPVPPPSPERALLCAARDASDGDGFHSVFAEPALRAVRQGAGQLWRSPSDRGLLVLLGDRFVRDPYRALLPDEWLAGHDVDALCGDPAEAAEAFFSGSAVDADPLHHV